MTGEKFHALFNARSIALLGASKDRRKWGVTMLNNLINDGFSERIYPVNPKEDEILKGIDGHQ